MGNYTRQARNFTTNVPKILDLKSSSEQIFSKNCRWVPLVSVTYTKMNGFQFKKTKTKTKKQLALLKMCVTSLLCSPRADLWPFYGFLGKRYSLYIKV